MPVIPIQSLSDPSLQVFASLTDAQLRSKVDGSRGVFIAESPKVIRTALDSGLEPLSLLCERRHIGGDAADIIHRCPHIPVYTGDRECLAGLTGYTLTRGVLCCMRRPAPALPSEICKEARRIAVLQGICDTTNIGSIFRSAAALGLDAVLLTPDTCDPLNRRAIRVSMGSVFRVPWAWLDKGPVQAQLHTLGFVTAAMALSSDSVTLTDRTLHATPRLAIILGTEGDGLPQRTIREADFVVRIPMHHEMDSLNVATAAAIAFWQLTSQA